MLNDCPCDPWPVACQVPGVLLGSPGGGPLLCLAPLLPPEMRRNERESGREEEKMKEGRGGREGGKV